MNSYEHYFTTNKKTWNTKVAAHIKSEFYDVDAFIKGKSSLNQYELDALADVKNKSLLHLQCHFGLDTLSFSRLGAKCVGIDFSNIAITEAKKLNTQLQLDAKFICCNVYDTAKYINEKFDLVYTSYGVIGWLPDLQLWGKQIVQRLKNGGIFYLVEFHPIIWMFDYLEKPPKLKYGYMQEEVIYEEYEGTYANTNAKIISKEYGWNHGLGSVITALTNAGLHIEYMEEYNESPYNVLPNLVKTHSGMYTTKDQLYPLIFAIKAIKKY